MEKLEALRVEELETRATPLLIAHFLPGPNDNASATGEEHARYAVVKPEPCPPGQICPL